MVLHCIIHQVIVIMRLSDGNESLLQESQCGFRRGRFCTDQLFALRVIIEQALEYNLPLFINFIDFKAAFDSVILNTFGLRLSIPDYLRSISIIFQAFYSDTTSAVYIGGTLTDRFDVKSGTGQGDIQAPPISTLF